MRILGIPILCDEPHKVFRHLMQPQGDVVLPVNESVTDRDIRLGVGLLMFLFGFFGATGMWQIILSIVGLVLIVTAATGFCPLYTILRVNTAAGERNGD